MEVKRDLYLNRLKDRMHNGMIKVVTGVRRCGKTYLLFNLFGDYLRGELGVPDDHIVEVALDTDECAALRDPSALGEHVRSRTGGRSTMSFSTRSSTPSATRSSPARSRRGSTACSTVCCACETSTSTSPAATRSFSHLT